MDISFPYGKGRIVHLRTNEPQLLSTALKVGLSLNTQTISELLELGSIYIDFKRTTVDQQINSSQIVRIHQNPVRFKTRFEWGARIVFQNENFIIANKPSGIPTHATLDNSVENFKFQLEQHLKIPLHINARLDILTQGLILFSKTKLYQSKFNELIRNQKIEKFYSASTDHPLPPGRYLHYMEPSKYAPKKMSSDPLPGWLKCELIILENHQIQLITGRTHQIRAQLAHMGSPLSGDPVYNTEPGCFDLTCVGLKFDCPLTQETFYFKL